MQLKDTAIRAIKTTGKIQKLSDGGGMYLYISAKGNKSWRMDYRFNDKRKTLTLL